jgi:hypothetical protein
VIALALAFVPAGRAGSVGVRGSGADRSSR